jgi:hypothetical protein
MVGTSESFFIFAKRTQARLFEKPARSALRVIALSLL